MRVEVIIAAGGVGKRLGKSQPKQFFLLKGKPILSWTIDRFEECPLVDGIVLVIPTRMQDYTREHVLSPHGYRKVRDVVEGGRRRNDSVLEGLKMLDEDTDTVLVHDGVRPTVSQKLIMEVIRGAQRWKAVVPGLPVRETIKEASGDNLVEKTLDRERVYLIQTPQGFKRNLLCQAHEEARKRGWQTSDDASLVERLGVRVRIIPGEETNVKITSPEDLVTSELFLDQY